MSIAEHAHVLTVAASKAWHDYRAHLDAHHRESDPDLSLCIEAMRLRRLYVLAEEAERAVRS